MLALAERSCHFKKKVLEKLNQEIKPTNLLLYLFLGELERARKFLDRENFGEKIAIQ